MKKEAERAGEVDAKAGEKAWRLNVINEAAMKRLTSSIRNRQIEIVKNGDNNRT